MGPILCSITEGSRGWHDPIGGHNDRLAVLEERGPPGYQEERNAGHRNTRKPGPQVTAGQNLMFLRPEAA